MAALRLVAALILAFAAWLWGMPWPWLRAIAMVALPICAALNLVVSFDVACLGKAWPWQRAHGGCFGLPCLPTRGFFFFFSK